ncbi:MAG: hypothetical protein ACRDZP_09675 [Acidimicrobiales bacterium]
MPVRIGAPRGGPPRSETLRRDRWWVQPLVTGLGLLAFAAYATWTAFRGHSYYAGSAPGLPLHLPSHYLSPFYSPCITGTCPAPVRWGPLAQLSSISPAILILIFPLGFRVTCYYYRKTYYRSFWASPPACAVADAGSRSPGGLRSKYSGESRFPLVWQNVHRYFWYFALIFAGLLTWDAVEAFRFGSGWGMGLGSLIFVANAALIWAYTLGCHACRHICGGGLRSFSKAPARFRFWRSVVTPLNAHHQLWAWASLIWIAWADFYVWLVATGTLHDPRFF